MHFLGNSREVDNAEVIQHTPVLFLLFPCEAVLHHHLCRSQEEAVFCFCTAPITGISQKFKQVLHVPNLTGTMLRWLKLPCPIH